jgi:GAF domain-containing protein/anti-sigma regulatory factor (Ser/Thr protein kinase)
VTRGSVKAFTDKQIELVTTFADQAVIAIENVRLFEEVQARTAELTESLEYQTATSEVLGVISRSPNELQPVLDAIVAIAARICQAYIGDIVLVDNQTTMRVAASIGDLARPAGLIPLDRTTVMGRSILDGAPVHVEDLQNAGEEFPAGQRLALRYGHRTILGVPLLRGGRALGTILLRRDTIQPFSEKQIALLKTFADQAVIAINNVGLFDEVQARTAELTESLEYQTATSDVLNVISRSPNDLQPVLDTIVETAHELCEAQYSLFLKLGADGLYHVAAGKDADPGFLEWLRAHPIAPGDGTATGLATLEKQTIHLHDALVDPRFKAVRVQQRSKARTQLAVPLMRAGVVIGVIFLARTEVKPFTDRQVNLVTTFADQAVIAINNVGLFEEVQARTAELQESLEYQTATSDVLNVISRSPSDLQPVLDAIADTAAHLCGSNFAFVYKLEVDTFRLAASNNAEAEFVRFLRDHPVSPGRGTVIGRTLLEKRTIHVEDVLADPEYTDSQRQRIGNYRSVLGVPLIRDQTVLGAIILVHSALRPFTRKQIELVGTFADQAVIAIENVRLFEEVQARTAELQESLEYQTATSDVLNVISRSPSETQPVLDAIVQTASALCGAEDTAILLREGAALRIAAHHGPIPLEFDAKPIERGWVAGRSVVDRAAIHVQDLAAAGDEFPLGSSIAEKFGHRTTLAIPLLRENEAVGCLLLRRLVVLPFTDKQIELVETFADQAVIAIENARLFEEVQARTRELTESLEFQTATSDVLNVISRSPSDIQPVLDAIVDTAARLCRGDFAIIWKLHEDRYHAASIVRDTTPELAEYARANPIGPGRGTLVGRVALQRATVHIPDVTLDPDYQWSDGRWAGLLRTMLGVPLLHRGAVIGVIAVHRRMPQPFSQREIDLVTTFADQAVIAINNVGLFEEVQARTAELQRSVSELQALSDVSHAVNSTLDLKTVLDTIVSKAVQLSATDAGAIYVYSNLRQKFRLRATYGMSQEMIDAVSLQHIGLGESYIGSAAHRREPLQVPDLADEPPSPMRDLVLHAGYRALLVVPLLRSDRIVGALVVRREAPGLFPKSTIELLKAFAAQSVLAIQNARLFSEIEQKSREIEIASRHKSQFLANMSHELRTPMNAVLGFTEMMSDGLYGALPEKALKALERVQANGKHLLGLINDVLDLSKIEAGQLTLALEDYAVGQVVQTVISGTESLAKAKGLALTAKVQEGLPLGRGDERRLTQVLLNLVGNAIKFTDKGSVEIAARAEDGFFDICVHDTGPGIAPDDQKRIFEEFQQVDNSSTRKKGGTGLGLAISKRLIEMHGGTLSVESVPGEGSTFRVAVPVRAEEQREAAE